MQLGRHLGKSDHEDGEGDVDRQESGQDRPQYPPLVALRPGQSVVDPVTEEERPGNDDPPVGTGPAAREHGLRLDHLAGIEAPITPRPSGPRGRPHRQSVRRGISACNWATVHRSGFSRVAVMVHGWKRRIWPPWTK